MRNNKDKFFLTLIPLIFITLVLHRFVNEPIIVKNFLIKFTDIMLPCIWGFLIAYLLNPLLNFCQRKLKLKKSFSIIIIYILLLILLIGIILIIIPTIYDSLSSVLSDIPTKEEFMQIIDNMNNFITSKLEVFNLQIDDLGSLGLEDFFAKIPDLVRTYTSKLLSTTYGLTVGILKFVIGIMISIYILSDKENFSKRSIALIKAVFGEEKSLKIFDFIKEADKMFNAFIVGKFIDSAIIGGICFIGMILMHVRYSVLLSLFVGITNMIPYFGPFIGAVPAVILTLFYDPVLAIWVAVFILILQQIDGYIIGPWVLGDTVGISSFWIIFAILLFGGYFGIIGMLIGVPIVALTRNIVNRNIDKVLEARKENSKKYN